MFENKIIKGIHVTRFIMSWIREGGTLDDMRGDYYDFQQWLESLGLSESEVNNILEISKNGKLELEISAKNFIKNKVGK